MRTDTSNKGFAAFCSMLFTSSSFWISGGFSGLFLSFVWADFTSAENSFSIMPRLASAIAAPRLLPFLMRAAIFESRLPQLLSAGAAMIWIAAPSPSAWIFENASMKSFSGSASSDWYVLSGR